MAPNEADFLADEEMAHSIRTIQKQRRFKLSVAIFAMIACAVVGSVAVYLAYNDAPDVSPGNQQLK